MAKEYIRQGIRLSDTKLRLLALSDYFLAVVSDRINTVLLVPKSKISTINKLRSLVLDIRVDALSY